VAIVVGGTLHVFHVESGKLVTLVSKNYNIPNARMCAFSTTDTCVVVVATCYDVKRFCATTGACLGTTDGVLRSAYSISPLCAASVDAPRDSRHLTVGPITEKRRNIVAGFEGTLLPSVAWTPDGAAFATAYPDGTQICVWSTFSGALVGAYDTKHWPNTLALCNGAHCFAVHDGSRRIHILRFLPRDSLSALLLCDMRRRRKGKTSWLPCELWEWMCSEFVL
jgi:WD40 repeat protein